MSAVIPKVSKLSPLITRVLGCNPGLMTLQGTNTYLVGKGRNRTLIDTGEPNVSQYISSLKNVIDENGIKLSQIVITHWHSDHIGGVSDVLQSLQLTDTECTIYKMCSEEHDRQYSSAIRFHYLRDGQRLRTDADDQNGVTLRVVATPGHTTDHLILVLEEENAVFSGDCILGEGSAVFEDLYSYMQSLQIILDLKPSVIYPGHGNVVNEPMAKIKEYIAHRLLREQQILNAMTAADRALTSMEIVKIVYKEVSEQLYSAAELNVCHHLEKLVKERKVWKMNENQIIKYTIV